MGRPPGRLSFVLIPLHSEVDLPNMGLWGMLLLPHPPNIISSLVGQILLRSILNIPSRGGENLDI
jgi:hypothetical protein